MSNSDGLTTKEAIRRTVRWQGALTSEEIVQYVEEMGVDVRRSTIRNIIYRMARDGELHKRGPDGSEHIYKMPEDQVDE